MAVLSTVIGYGLLGARPTAGSEGRLYYATDTALIYRDNGSSWDTLTIVGTALTQIAQTTLGASAASITFSSIPGTYNSLALHISAQGTSSGVQVNAQFNGDTGANYDYMEMAAHGSTVSPSETLAATSLRVGGMAPSTANANAVGATIAYVLQYANTNWRKAIISQDLAPIADTTGNIYTRHRSGVWRSTSAITSIVLSPDSGSFAAHTVATLYGIA